MIKRLPVLFIFLLAQTSLANDSRGKTDSEKASPKTEVRVTCHGLLNHTGKPVEGKTTGTSIKSDNCEWELNLKTDDAKKFAESNNKKPVIVVGILQKSREPHEATRWIVDVEQIKKQNQDEKKGEISVEFPGKLRTGIMAMGGETTGTVIENEDGIKFELDLSRATNLKESADKFDKQPVTATGKIRLIKGVNDRPRYIICVKKLESGA